MISKTMQDTINAQINKELHSSYLYLSMAAYFEEKSLPGFSKWMHIQATEEREHAMKFYEHLVDRGGRVLLTAIAAPETDWPSNLAVFQQAKEHEAKVTKAIYDMYEQALNEKDFPTQVLLQWFITEQVEEEKNASEIVHQLEMIEEHKTAVLMLDHQLAKRNATTESE